MKDKTIITGEVKIDTDYILQKQFLNNIKRKIILEKYKTVFYKYITTLEVLKEYKKHTGKTNTKELNDISKYCRLKIKEMENDRNTI